MDGRAGPGGRLGDLARAAGDSATADHHYRAALTIRERLATTDPGNVQYQQDLEWSRQRLASLTSPADLPEPGTGTSAPEA